MFLPPMNECKGGVCEGGGYLPLFFTGQNSVNEWTGLRSEGCGLRAEEVALWRPLWQNWHQGLCGYLAAGWLGLCGHHQLGNGLGKLSGP